MLQGTLDFLSPKYLIHDQLNLNSFRRGKKGNVNRQELAETIEFCICTIDMLLQTNHNKICPRKNETKRKQSMKHIPPTFFPIHLFLLLKQTTPSWFAWSGQVFGNKPLRIIRWYSISSFFLPLASPSFCLLLSSLFSHKTKDLQI